MRYAFIEAHNPQLDYLFSFHLPLGIELFKKNESDPHHMVDDTSTEYHPISSED